MKLFSTILVLLSINSSLFSQEPVIFNQNNGQAIFNEAFEKSYNIKAGIGYQSLLIEKGEASFSNKTNLTPNTLSYYISFTASDRWMETNTYLNYEIQFVQRKYRATPNQADTVSLLSCSKIDYYFFSVPFQLSFRKAIGKIGYWAINPGIYFDYLLIQDIYNGDQKKYVDKDLKSLDFGLNTSVEFGIRAGYLGFSFKNGLKNLAKDMLPDLTFRNNGLLSFFVGYRFGTEIGKKDAERVKKVISY
jgi:hypothetical protein